MPLLAWGLLPRLAQAASVGPSPPWGPWADVGVCLQWEDNLDSAMGPQQLGLGPEPHTPSDSPTE